MPSKQESLAESLAKDATILAKDATILAKDAEGRVPQTRSPRKGQPPISVRSQRTACSEEGQGNPEEAYRGPPKNRALPAHGIPEREGGKGGLGHQRGSKP